MQAAFGTVLWIVCGVGLLAAVAALLMSGKTWDELGKNHLLMDTDLPREPGTPSAAATMERDIEIRQMLEATNLRRRRRGEQPIDIEEEFRRLTATQIDPELRAEIRDLVIEGLWIHAPSGLCVVSGVHAGSVADMPSPNLPSR